MLYKNEGKEKGAAIHDFLYWVTHEGQSAAAPLNYAKLPEGVIARVEEKLKAIQVSQG